MHENYSNTQVKLLLCVQEPPGGTSGANEGAGPHLCWHGTLLRPKFSTYKYIQYSMNVRSEVCGKNGKKE
jgi:hypothetical protein